MAQNPPASNLAPPPSWQRPVHRVANAALSSTTQPTSVRPTGGHPNLRRGLDMARDALAKSEAQVRDYTATLVKRERIGQTLGEHEFMMVKIRNRKIAGGQVIQPFSVYIQFLKPAATKGREVIYVENQNNGKLIAHEGGMKGRFLPTVSLPVDGMLAMRGQRYPMTEIGVENMIVKLIDRGETALQFDDVSADFFKNARVRDRVCTLLRVKQPTRRPELDFYQADVFLDDQLGLPIRYIAYDWPAPGSPADALGGVIEEYNYLNLQLNVGLSDSDFDSNNPAYNF
ncbi:MAG: DUF1571 domain-containing protein [Planctomycetota bacterium]